MLSRIPHQAAQICFRTLVLAIFAVLFGLNLSPTFGGELRSVEVGPTSIRTANCNSVINARSKNVSLTISAEGKLFWNQTPISDVDELLTRAKQFAILVPPPEVHLCADQRVKYQQVGRVVMQLQRAGIAKVSYAIRNQIVTLDLPIYPFSAPSASEIVHTIDFDFDGSMFLDGSPILNFANMEIELRKIAADPTHPLLHLRPNKLVEYKSVADVLDLAHQLGMKKIDIVGNQQFMGAAEVFKLVVA